MKLAECHARKQWLGSGAMCFALQIALSATPAVGDPSLRAWTPEDSIAVRYISAEMGDPGTWPSERAQGAVVFSPDGRQFFFISHHGELSSDSEVYELQIFSVETVRQALSQRTRSKSKAATPARTIVFRSSSSEAPGIANVRWQPDSRAILFRGMADGGTLQALRLDVSSGAVEQLTRDAREVAWFEYENGVTVYRVSPAQEPPRSLRYPFEYVVRGRNGGVVLPGDEAFKASPAIYSAARSGTDARTLDVWFTSGMWASPDGQKVLLLGRAGKIDDPGRPLSFHMMDLGTESIRRLFEVPVGPRSPRKRAADQPDAAAIARPVALWSADSTRVILVNAKLPPEVEGGSRGSDSAYVLEWRVTERQWKIIEPMSDAAPSGHDSNTRYVSAAAWSKDGSTLSVSHEVNGKATDETLYTLSDGAWVGRAVSAPVAASEARAMAGLQVSVQQGANDPPLVIASDGARTIPLTVADPALQGIWRARMEPFQWRTADGKAHTGGLLLPRDGVKAGPVPLVIQNYHYWPQLFLPDGPHAHIDAAQALVAQGMAVLQINNVGDMIRDSTYEGEGGRFVENVDSIVEALARLKIVDPKRVGLTGFSRGGYQAYYAVAHPGRITLAAAVCGDSFTADYTTYLITSATGVQSDGVEMLFGSRFWDNKAKWLEQENSFNVDRVQTPTLFSETFRGSLMVRGYPVLSLPTIGAFLRNQKPMDYIYLPEASHVLRRPRERLEMMQAVVDWMNLWLNNKPPADVERATRWNAIKSAWDARKVMAAQ